MRERYVFNHVTLRVGKNPFNTAARLTIPSLLQMFGRQVKRIKGKFATVINDENSRGTLNIYLFLKYA